MGGNKISSDQGGHLEHVMRTLGNRRGKKENCFDLGLRRAYKRTKGKGTKYSKSLGGRGEGNFINWEEKGGMS